MNLNVSMNEAAKMLCLSHDRLQELVTTGEIPAWRDGRNWKIPVDDLREWNSNKAKREAERRRHEAESVQAD